MGWIKRNLFFVIGGIITLVLLGTAGFYIYKGWSANSDASATLNELYGKIATLDQEPVQPGNDKVDNVAIAKDQEQQMEAWINQAVNYFQPIPSIPAGAVDSKTFATALGNTVYQLQLEAKAASVNLPPQYNFSFQAQSTKLTISSGLGPLAEQLGQVKVISEILFNARVNDLLGIQRVRMSDDDVGGLTSDYIDDRPITNNLAIITPYLVTFQTFTPELASVLVGFATSTNPFVVKLVSVEPANSSGSPMASTMPQMPQPYFPQGGGYPQGGGLRPGMQQPPNGYPLGAGYPPGGQPPYQTQPGMPAPTGKGGLQTVIKEQLLRITLQVNIVKLLPKS